MAYPAIAESSSLILNTRPRATHLEVEWDDHGRSKFHYIWLRDNCYCERCHDPHTHQKMVWLVDIPHDIAPGSIDVSPDGVDIEWTQDRHRSRYDARWLRAHCYSARGRSERKFRPKHWDATAARSLTDIDYREVMRSDAAELELLERVRDYGFALLHHVPAEREETERIGRRFGYPRETNWGLVLDILSEPGATNIANTGEPIAPHTDDSFRYAMPGIEMFHCLEAGQNSGGESLLVDGFNLAEVLRAENPDAFELVSSVSAPQFALDTDTELRARGPIFTLDDDGNVVGVRYCECTQAPLDLPEDLVLPFYSALRCLARLVQRDDLVFRFRLNPGDTVVFDNQRVLHGRTGFEGRRLLRNVYIDRDSFHSRLRVLGQRHQRQDFHLDLPAGAGH